MEVAVRTLKELIHFIKEGRKKQLILLVMIIRLDNNSQTDTQVLINSRYIGSYINQ